MSTTPDTTRAAQHVARTHQTGWGRLLIICSITSVVAQTLMQATGRFFGFPSMPIYAIAILIGLVLLYRRQGRSGIVVLGIFNLLNAALHGLIFFSALFIPAAPAMFATALATLLSSVIAIPAAVLAFRRVATPWQGLPRFLALAMSAAIGLSVIGGIAAYATRTSDKPVAGELAVDLADIAGKKLTAEAGDATIAVTNSDPLNPAIFVVEELDIKIGIAPGVTKRVEIDAPAGTYKFREDYSFDQGTLTIH